MFQARRQLLPAKHQRNSKKLEKMNTENNKIIAEFMGCYQQEGQPKAWLF